MDEQKIVPESKNNTDELVKNGIVPYLKDIGSVLVIVLFVFLEDPQRLAPQVGG